jgi:transcriptional regulator with AAA-type ATPase domain
METMQEVQAYLSRELQGMHSPHAPERLMAEVLEELAGKCQSVEEFIEKVEQIPVNGAGIEEVEIANEYREIVLEAIQG